MTARRHGLRKALVLLTAAALCIGWFPAVKAAESDLTDQNGEVLLSDVLITVTDADGPVEDAVITLEAGILRVYLTDTRLDYANQTTITVLSWEDGTAVSGWEAAVSDKDGGYASGTTDISGAIVVPQPSGVTGEDGRVTIGWEDGTQNHTITVRVGNGYEIFSGAAVSADSTGNLFIFLPENLNFEENYPLHMTVLDEDGMPISGQGLTLDAANHYGSGSTDAEGQLTIPAAEAISTGYICGHPDGSFAPDQNLTRGEAAVMLAKLLSEQNGDRLDDTETTFSDVESMAWYAGAVSYLERFGILSGYDDSTFRPDEDITRAELIFMTVHCFYTGPDNVDCPYSDVSSDYWACDEICKAESQSWMSGEDCFRPEDPITRAEAVVLLNRASGRRSNADTNPFTDVPEDYWAFYDICAAANDIAVSK